MERHTAFVRGRGESRRGRDHSRAAAAPANRKRGRILQAPRLLLRSRLAPAETPGDAAIEETADDGGRRAQAARRRQLEDERPRRLRAGVRADRRRLSGRAQDVGRSRRVPALHAADELRHRVARRRRRRRRAGLPRRGLRRAYRRRLRRNDRRRRRQGGDRRPFRAPRRTMARPTPTSAPRREAARRAKLARRRSASARREAERKAGKAQEVVGAPARGLAARTTRPRPTSSWPTSRSGRSAPA